MLLAMPLERQDLVDVSAEVHNRYAQAAGDVTQKTEQVMEGEGVRQRLGDTPAISRSICGHLSRIRDNLAITPGQRHSAAEKFGKGGDGSHC